MIVRVATRHLNRAVGKASPNEANARTAADGAIERLSYWEQLQHPKWQKRSAQIKEAAGWSCEDCGCKDRQLSTHHTAYVPGKLLWEYGIETLMCLCDPCHKSRQNKEDAFRIALGKITRFIRPADLEWEVWRILDKVSQRQTARLASAFNPEEFKPDEVDLA